GRGQGACSPNASSAATRGDEWGATLDRDARRLVTIAFPPVELREDFDFERPAIANSVQHATIAGNIDNTIADHAPVLIDVARGHQPVGEMETQNPAGPGLDQALLEERIPP